VAFRIMMMMGAAPAAAYFLLVAYLLYRVRPVPIAVFVDADAEHRPTGDGETQTPHARREHRPRVDVQYTHAARRLFRALQPS